MQLSNGNIYTIQVAMGHISLENVFVSDYSLNERQVADFIHELFLRMSQLFEL